MGKEGDLVVCGLLGIHFWSWQLECSGHDRTSPMPPESVVRKAQWVIVRAWAKPTCLFLVLTIGVCSWARGLTDSFTSQTRCCLCWDYPSFLLVCSLLSSLCIVDSSGISPSCSSFLSIDLLVINSVLVYIRNVSFVCSKDSSSWLSQYSLLLVVS